MHVVRDMSSDSEEHSSVVRRADDTEAKEALRLRPVRSRAISDFLYIHGHFDQYRGSVVDRVNTLAKVVNWFVRAPWMRNVGGLGERFYTTKIALNWMLQHHGSNIVETGTMGEPDNWSGVGCSTNVLGEVVAKHDGHLWTCDISAEAIATAKQSTAAFREHITYVCDDSVSFLSNFPETIDLLYLDSMDCPRRGDATEPQLHCLRELRAALPKLSQHAVVLLDDNRFRNGGKTRLAKQFLEREGWICLFDWHQSVWVRCCSNI